MSSQVYCPSVECPGHMYPQSQSRNVIRFLCTDRTVAHPIVQMDTRREQFVGCRQRLVLCDSKSSPYSGLDFNSICTVHEVQLQQTKFVSTHLKKLTALTAHCRTLNGRSRRSGSFPFRSVLIMPVQMDPNALEQSFRPAELIKPLRVA